MTNGPNKVPHIHSQMDIYVFTTGHLRRPLEFVHFLDIRIWLLLLVFFPAVIVDCLCCC